MSYRYSIRGIKVRTATAPSWVAMVEAREGRALLSGERRAVSPRMASEADALHWMRQCADANRADAVGTKLVFPDEREPQVRPLYDPLDAARDDSGRLMRRNHNGAEFTYWRADGAALCYDCACAGDGRDSESPHLAPRRPTLYAHGPRLACIGCDATIESVFGPCAGCGPDGCVADDV